MRGEGGKEAQEGKTYAYEKCPGCGAKLHIDAHYCLNCGEDYWNKCMTGEWRQVLYRSRNQEDAIYSVPMNDTEKCMKCANVTQRGIACRPKHCFATGRGKCGNCRMFDNTLFDCCQEAQKADGVVTGENIKAVKECLRRIGKGPVPAAKPQAEPAGQYNDGIPF
jgi:hypothetical protein